MLTEESTSSVFQICFSFYFHSVFQLCFSITFFILIFNLFFILFFYAKQNSVLIWSKTEIYFHFYRKTDSLNNISSKQNSVFMNFSAVTFSKQNSFFILVLKSWCRKKRSLLNFKIQVEIQIYKKIEQPGKLGHIENICHEKCCFRLTCSKSRLWVKINI